MSAPWWLETFRLSGPCFPGPLAAAPQNFLGSRSYRVCPEPTANDRASSLASVPGFSRGEDRGGSKAVKAAHEIRSPGLCPVLNSSRAGVVWGKEARFLAGDSMERADRHARCLSAGHY